MDRFCDRFGLQFLLAKHVFDAPCAFLYVMSIISAFDILGMGDVSFMIRAVVDRAVDAIFVVIVVAFVFLVVRIVLLLQA